MDYGQCGSNLTSPDLVITSCLPIDNPYRVEPIRQFWASRRQLFPDPVMEESPVTQEKLRNSPELFGNLAFGVWNLRLPQFDRISLRVVQASEPAVGIRLRVNVDRDSRSL